MEMIIYLHGGMMTAGFAVARSLRGKRFWIRARRALGLSGASSIGLGFLAALYMVSGFGVEHLAVLHSCAGAVTVFMCMMTPVLGRLSFVLRSRAAEIRAWHRRSGAMTILMVFLTIISGLVQAGVLPDLREF